MKSKLSVKDFVPPIAVSMVRRLTGRGRYGFAGDYASWNDALAQSTGYNAAHILQRVDEAVRQVRSGAAVYERDSVIFDTIQYSWPVLAGLLRVASEQDGRLTVMDFGGSLGTSYYQNRGFLSTVRKLRWCVVDQPSFVELGKEKYQDAELVFYRDIQECIRQEPVNVALLSGVLQYVEEPHAVLRDILKLGINTVILDRTPLLLHADRDRLTVQRVPPTIYNASYPHWFFEQAGLLKHFAEQGYACIADFDGCDVANIPNSIYRGYIFSKMQLRAAAGPMVVSEVS